MKAFKNAAFTALLTMGVFSTALYTSCSKDDCKDVVCNNGGTCVSGTCSCPSGYEGSTCQTASASKITGTYTSSETCQPPVAGGNWSSTLTQSSGDATKIIISNFGDSGSNVTGKVSGTGITLDNTQIGGQTVSGSGTVNGNIVTITYRLTGGTQYDCTMTMTKQ